MPKYESFAFYCDNAWHEGKSNGKIKVPLTFSSRLARPPTCVRVRTEGFYFRTEESVGNSRMVCTVLFEGASSFVSRCTDLYKSARVFVCESERITVGVFHLTDIGASTYDYPATVTRRGATMQPMF